MFNGYRAFFYCEIFKFIYIMKVVLNIGLNVGNSEPTNQLNDSLGALLIDYKVRNFKVVEGEYKDSEGRKISERTLVVELYIPQPNFDIPIRLKTLAYQLNQDCISYKIDNKITGLSYRNGWTSQMQDFDANYFTDL